MIDSTDSNQNAYLIVGLGNPGPEYRQTRHNFGFMVADQLAEELQIRFKRVKFKAMIGEGKTGGKSVILAKPLTFMNDSGQAVAALMKYFKVPLENLLVLHDDLDLPLGTIRLRPQGGTSGQRGMASIVEKLGTQNFPRLRLGISRPPGQMDPVEYVLQKFSPGELELQKMVTRQAAEAALLFIHSGLETAMNKYNGDVG